jgi:hypothetical protein
MDIDVLIDVLLFVDKNDIYLWNEYNQKYLLNNRFYVDFKKKLIE